MLSKWLKINMWQSMEPVRMTSWDYLFTSFPFIFFKEKLLCILLLLDVFGFNRNTSENKIQGIKSFMHSCEV
jgi:hypothetical protein